MWENEWHYLDHIECYWNAYSVPILCTEYAVYSVLEYREKNQHSRFFFKKYMGLEKYYTTTHIQHNIYNTRLQFFLFGNHWFLVPQTIHQQGPGPRSPTRFLVQVNIVIITPNILADMTSWFLFYVRCRHSAVTSRRDGNSRKEDHHKLAITRWCILKNTIQSSKIHMEGKEEVRQNDDSPWLMLCVSK